MACYLGLIAACLAVAFASASAVQSFIGTPLAVEETTLSGCSCSDLPLCSSLVTRSSSSLCVGTTQQVPATCVDTSNCNSYAALDPKLLRPGVRTPCELSCGGCPCCQRGLGAVLYELSSEARMFTQALLLSQWLDDVTNPALSATVLVPTNGAFMQLLEDISCNSLAALAAVNRTLLRDIVASHFLPATILVTASSRDAPLAAGSQPRQGLITDITAGNLTLVSSAWGNTMSPLSASTGAPSPSPGAVNVLAAAQLPLVRTALTGPIATNSTGSSEGIASMNSTNTSSTNNGSGDWVFGRLRRLAAAVTSTSPNPVTRPMVWNLTSRTIAVRVTPGQGLDDAPPSPPPMYSRDGDTSYGPGSTSSPSTVSEVFAPQPGANGLVAVLYGPGNNVAQGAKVLGTALVTCRSLVYQVNAVLLPYVVPSGICRN
ncbi:hypothetical protein V8C86DRAFT_2473575 [Haematococcus lacustris]